jgi:hypothetical protein
MGKQKLLKNAPLQPGDKVICLKMQDDYGVAGGIPGIVKNVSNVFGENQYNVNWKTGSTLALIEGVDQWLKVVEEEDENVQESRVMTKREFLEEAEKNIPQEFVKYSRLYDMRLIKRFLDLVRDSGITNMFASAHYLYMGEERIAHEHYYDEMDESRQESFDELLEIAEDVRREMINGAMKHYLAKSEKDKNDDEDDRYLRNIESYIRRDATNLLKLWMTMKGGSQSMK